MNRCLGYAEALTNLGFKCLFYGNYDDGAQAIITDSGLMFELTEPIGVPDWVSRTPVHLSGQVLLDSYNISASDVSIINEKMNLVKFVLIDDFYKLDYYHCDAIINFTIGANDMLTEARTCEGLFGDIEPQLFLGPNYYPARAWLRSVRKMRPQTAVTEVEKILIVTGGRDNSGTTIKLLELLYKVKKESEVAVLLVNDEESNNIIDNYLNKFSKSYMFVHQPNLGDWYNWADVCLCGGGLIKYECLFVGLPVVSLSQTAEQQIDSSKHKELGLICDLGMNTDVDTTVMEQKLGEFINDVNYRQYVIDKGRTVVGGENNSIMVEPFITNTV